MKCSLQRALIGTFIVALVGCGQVSKQKSAEKEMASGSTATSIEDSLQTVVSVVGGTNGQPVVRGSGMFISEDGHILTNAHVVTNDHTRDAYPEITISTTANIDEPAQCFATAQVLAANQELDLALLEIVSPLDINCDALDTSEFGEFWYTDPKTDSVLPRIGDQLTAIGFPGIGGETVTVTQGHVSGFVGGDGTNPGFIKTDTLINHGNSGGAAFSKDGKFVGIPSAFQSDASGEGGVLGLLIPADEVNSWLDRLLDRGVLKESLESESTKGS
jgi:S1-C subfamily serine protease